MVDLIIFPSGYFNVKKVDEDFQQEYEAAASTGLFHITLFDNDRWFDDGKLMLHEVPSKHHKAVYRGWMMKPEQYQDFYNQLSGKNIYLITKPEEYALMHIFPNVYDCFGDDTARMEIYPLHEQIDVERLKERFDRFMVKDFVKSVKGTEFPRYFDHSVTQKEFDDWMQIFYQYRGDLLTGGICIKEYLDLREYGGHTNEWRIFYMNQIPASICRNSGQDSLTPAPPRELIEKYCSLQSPYYTVDYAELTDGSWRVIEAGDGEVSGLPEAQDNGQYFRTLYKCFR